MADLTAITTPYGLLDPETQEALKAHGGPYECYRQEGGGYAWMHPANASIDTHHAIAWRVKPAPPQPRTIYLCEFRDGERSFHATAIDATKAALSYGHGATVSEWREVLS